MPPSKTLLHVVLVGLLVSCAPRFWAPSPLVTARASYGDGLLFFTVTNTSGRPLVFWNDLCLLRAVTTLMDGTPVFPKLGAGPWCAPRARMTSTVLAAGESVVVRKDWPMRPGTYLMRVSVDLTVAPDPRSEEQRRMYGAPAPESGCQGIPCAPEYPFGMAPDDPFNPQNLPGHKEVVEAPPITVTVPDRDP